MLKNIFISLVSKYTNQLQIAESLWDEIVENYHAPQRYYHTMNHLENLYQSLAPCKDAINDWDTLMATLFYHDIVYDSTKTDNELQSAIVAVARLNSFGFPELQIKCCEQQILATNGHLSGNDEDTHFFIDADLAILGADQIQYQFYSEQIRQEYSIYSDDAYKQGRQRVLTHFLNMDQIFKTSYFFDQFEKKARLNLSNELFKLKQDETQ